MRRRKKRRRRRSRKCRRKNPIAFRNEGDKIMGIGVSSYLRQEKSERLGWILSLAATLLRNVVIDGINTRIIHKYSVPAAQ